MGASAIAAARTMHRITIAIIFLLPLDDQVYVDIDRGSIAGDT
jgi:hypothetical protein